MISIFPPLPQTDHVETHGNEMGVAYGYWLIMSEELDDFVFYKDNPDWKDVQPIPQDDGPTPVVRIAYTKRCSLRVATTIVTDTTYKSTSFFLIFYYYSFSWRRLWLHESRH